MVGRDRHQYSWLVREHPLLCMGEDVLSSQSDAHAQQHVAMPKLMGAPAYARPPRLVDETPRPLHPDDLPLEAERTPEEHELASVIAPEAVDWTSTPLGRRVVDLPEGAADTNGLDKSRSIVARLGLRRS